MKSKKPWLQNDGQPYPDTVLREISQSWSLSTWEAYLDWFTTHAHRQQVLEEAQAESPLGGGEDSELASLCKELLAQLSDRDASLLKLFYLKNLSERQIGDLLGIPYGSVHAFRKRALRRLRTRIAHSELGTDPLVRGPSFEAEGAEPGVWERMILALHEVENSNGCEPAGVHN